LSYRTEIESRGAHGERLSMIASVQERDVGHHAAISRTFRRAPISANLDSTCFAFICFDLRFQAEAHRTKHEIQFHPANSADSADTNWFVALAKEQLALGAKGFHGIPFVRV